MIRSSRYISIFIFFIFLFTFNACGNQDQDQDKESTATSVPAYGDAIIWGSIGDASNLIPALASDTSSTAITSLVYDGLIKLDKNQDLVGALAERWEISPDGLTITFYLRKNAKWHDGQPFTAKDVDFTYRLMADPNTPTPYGEDFKQVKNAEIIDDYTFRVTYERPFAPGLASWSFNIMPAHLLSGQDITSSNLARHPIGTGPYIFKEWQVGQKIVIAANPNYFDGRPYIDQQITRIIPDQATMFLELKSGGLDYAQLTPDQWVLQTNNAKFKSSYNKYKYLGSLYTYMGFNLLDPKFEDIRVRQAIAYAINKEELVQGVLRGLGQVANGPYKPGSWPYNQAVTPYPFDQEKAKQLMAEAGWIDTDNDGFLDLDGQAFEFTIITNQGNKRREMAGLIIQQRLSQLGIKVKVRTVEWAAFLREFVDKKNFEAVILGWTIPVDPDLFDVFNSTKTKPGDLNFVTFKNPELDRLIDQGRYTFDKKIRKKAYDRIQEILKEEVPYVFLYVPDSLVAVASRFQGIDPGPAGITYNFNKWYVPQALQKHKLVP